MGSGLAPAKEENWDYVGDGHGSYIKVPVYAYVGDGRGDFDMEELPPPEEPPRFIAIPCFVGLLVTVPFVIWAFSHLPIGIRQAGQKDDISHNCDTSGDIAKDAWRAVDANDDGHATVGELLACVDEARCNELPDLSDRALNAIRDAGFAGKTLSQHDFEQVLMEALGEDISSWSEDKVFWCCTHKDVACSATSSAPHAEPKVVVVDKPPPPPTEVALAPAPASSGPPPEVRVAVIREPSKPAGEPPPLVTQAPLQRVVAPVYSPPAPLPQYAVSRPASARPAPISASVEDFDCSAGFSDWQRGWSIAKKEWCCAHYWRGCLEMQSPQTTTTATTTTTSTTFDWEAL